MAVKPKRLSKVTKEFNLGLTTVVDYLQEKGFEVESNPNAKISPEMYDALSQEFQTEKKVKEKSNKIEVKKPIKETISIEEDKPEPPKEEEKVPKPERQQVMRASLEWLSENLTSPNSKEVVMLCLGTAD